LLKGDRYDRNKGYRRGRRRQHRHRHAVVISNIPGWGAVPDQPKAAIIALVSSGIGAAIVYYAPSNKPTLTATAPEKADQLGAAFGSGRVLA
jgi:hypothetical protein